MQPYAYRIILVFAAFHACTLSAQVSFDSLKEQAAGYAEKKAAEYNVSPQVVEGLKNLAESFDLTQVKLGSLAQDALRALNDGEDVAALKYLDEIGEAASLSSGQRSLFEEAKVLVDEIVLQRNFSDIPDTAGPLSSAIGAIKDGDYGQAVAQLRAILNEASPTGSQREILEELQEQYENWSNSESE